MTAAVMERQRRTTEVMELWRRALPNARLHRILYEQVVAEPEATARQLVAAAGLAWDPAVLAFHENRDRVVATASALQVRQPLYKGAVGAYRPFLPWIKGNLSSIRDLMARYDAELGSEPLKDEL